MKLQAWAILGSIWRQRHFQSFCACACGAVHILDRNVVFSCGASDISSHFVRVRVARFTFWIVTWYFLVVPAAAAFQSFCVCVCACGSVRILERKKFAVAQADTPFEEESGLQC